MKNKHYLLTGRLVSSFGDSLYAVAIMWYVFHQTKDPFITGITSAILMLPMVLSVFVGPIIDHYNRKRIMLTAQILQMAVLIIVTLCFYFNLMPLPLLIFSFFVVGLLEIFEGNAEYALSPLVMSEDELMSYNSTIVTGNLIISSIAKAICVFIIIDYGIESIYLINILTFLFAVIMFAQIKYKHRDNGKLDTQEYRQSITEGISYFNKYGLIWLAVPAMIANFTGAMSEAILPAFTNDKGGPLAYGYYLTASVIFGAIGSVITPKLKSIDINMKITYAPLISAICMFLAAFIDSYYLSMLFYGLASLPIVIMNISTFTYIQTHIDNKVLARIGTIINAVCTAVMPVGALLGGYLGKVINPDIPIYITAGGFLLLGIIFIIRMIHGKQVLAINEQVQQ
ncbi:MFS transporter [Macrococcus brunensis]|uniref:MFS transporter n=1 Tax=Macrococcus brunensis TaxID=198483 RepID=UPI001EEFCC2A|nr:MFS transporter [Macrococcus brunensis]ULG72202.1 MFS transporter [Macrococcus brunensis]